MTDIVDQTLHEWRSTPFEYGQRDCMLSIGRYLAATGHKDITADFIGTYSTHEEALARMLAHGGIAGLMDEMGAKRRIGAPERGDVIEVMYLDDEVIGGIAGLCTGDSVALRLERGVIELRLRLVNCRGVWVGEACGSR